MHCPNCHAENLEDELYCHHCGEDLTAPSRNLVMINQRLPAVLHNPQLPRVAAGVGAVAVGVGLELLRRSLLARLTQPPRLPQSVTNTLPTLSKLREVLFPQNKKNYKLPKNYEIEETVVYLKRVIRRKN